MLFNAACTWLEVEADDPHFQFGSYSTQEHHLAKKPVRANSHLIVFARPYDTPPCVIIWLASFDIPSNNHWRIRTYASEITATGFRIHIDTWGDTVLNSGGATWVAYTADMPDICSGSFSSADNQSLLSNEPQAKGYTVAGSNMSGKWCNSGFDASSSGSGRSKRCHTGHQAFPRGLFTAFPSVIVALSELDVNCCRFLRVRVKTSELSVDGMNWQLEGWVDTDIDSAGASYIAMR